MKIENLNIKEIVPYEKNPRKNEKAVEIVSKSIKEFGFKVPIILDRNNTIIAGHTRLKAAIKLGMKEVPTIKAEDLTEQQVKAFRIMDNKSNEFADWDLDLLKEELTSLQEADFRLDLTGFSFKELGNILENEVIEDTVEVDAYERAKRKTKIQLGEIYQLEDHRLMCGDSTIKEDVDRLMVQNKADMVFTDPPYGMSFGSNPYEGGNRGTGGKAARVKAWGKLKNDELSGEEYKNFLDKSIVQLLNYAKEKAPFYIWGTWRTIKSYIDSFENNKLNITSIIVWDKQSIGLGYSNYKPQHEFCFYFSREAEWYGDLKNSDVWSRSRGNLQRYEHPTMKPLEFCGIGIKNSSKKEQIILDLFGGSGSTLIACEQLNRKCFMMELDPVYCQVIIDRWEKFTGKKAKKVKNSTKSEEK